MVEVLQISRLVPSDEHIQKHGCNGTACKTVIRVVMRCEDLPERDQHKTKTRKENTHIFQPGHMKMTENHAPHIDMVCHSSQFITREQ